MAKSKLTEYKVDESKNALVLDLSSTCTGYCIISNGKIGKNGYIRLTNDKKYKGNSEFALNDRVTRLRYKVKRLCMANKIDDIIVENSFMGSNPQIAITLGMVRGAVVSLGYPTYKIPVTSWKKYYGIKRGMNQKGMSKEIASKLIGETIKNDDRSDAILIANYVLHKEEL